MSNGDAPSPRDLAATSSPPACHTLSGFLEPSLILHVGDDNQVFVIGEHKRRIMRANHSAEIVPGIAK